MNEQPGPARGFSLGNSIKLDRIELTFFPFLPPERRKFFEMSSFVETKGMDILKGSPIEFVEYP